MRKVGLSVIVKDWQSWTSLELVEWIGTLHLCSDRRDNFRLTRITGKDLVGITPDYLDKINVKNSFDKISILNAISVLIRESKKSIEGDKSFKERTDWLDSLLNDKEMEIQDIKNAQCLNYTLYSNKTNNFIEEKKEIDHVKKTLKKPSKEKSESKRWSKFKPNELNILEAMFLQIPKISQREFGKLATTFMCPKSKIANWFYHRRNKEGKGKKTMGKVPLVNCAHCDYKNHVASTICLLCGHPFPRVFRSEKAVDLNFCSIKKMKTKNEKESVRFDCKLCGKYFAKPFLVKRHMIVHTGEKAFTCKICGKKFGYKQDRKRHEFSHSGKKPFSCEICGKNFMRKYSLKKHSKNHKDILNSENFEKNDEKTQKINKIDKNGKNGKNITISKKRFNCSFCNKNFDRSQNLIHHERIHTGEKPFQCQICDRKFVQEFHVKRHLKTHLDRKTFNCEVVTCALQFDSNKKLKNHHKEKHSRLNCLQCEAIFQRPSAFNRHVQKHLISVPIPAESKIF